MKKSEFWNQDEYYDFACKGSSDKNHPGMILLKELSQKASEILDLGCGEGSRLNYIARGKTGKGVDISDLAIKRARNKYRKFKFYNGNIEKLPFNDKSFDLIYSAYVLEHTLNPEKVIQEAIRTLRLGGSLVFIAPNFGSPNRASPNFNGSRIGKLVFGYIGDFLKLDSDKLGWKNVEICLKSKDYHIDIDATVEPYARSLVAFLKANRLSVVQFSTCWEQELPGANIYQKIFKILANFKVYPFVYWGPHLVVWARKIK